MNMRAASFVLVFALGACGGHDDDNDSRTDPPPVATNPASGTVADPTSAKYASALQAFAETFRGIEFLLTTNDLVLTAGVTQACPKGGSANYANGTETLNGCELTYPNDAAYSGAYAATVATSGNVSTVNATAINTLRVFDPTQTTKLQYTVASGTFAGTATNNQTSELTRLSSGSLFVNAGTISNYTVGQFGSQTTNNGTGLMVQQTAGSAKFLQVVKGINTYDVTGIQPLTILGDNFPSAGVISIAYNTTVGCSPLIVTYLPANQFSLGCGGQQITKNWTDADVVAARAASIQ